MNMTIIEREARAYAQGNTELAEALRLAIDAQPCIDAEIARANLAEEDAAGVRQELAAAYAAQDAELKRLHARIETLIGEVDEALRGGNGDTIEKLIPRVEAVLHKHAAQS